MVWSLFALNLLTCTNWTRLVSDTIKIKWHNNIWRSSAETRCCRQAVLVHVWTEDIHINRQGGGQNVSRRDVNPTRSNQQGASHWPKVLSSYEATIPWKLPFAGTLAWPFLLLPSLGYQGWQHGWRTLGGWQSAVKPARPHRGDRLVTHQGKQSQFVYYSDIVSSFVFAPEENSYTHTQRGEKHKEETQSHNRH